MQKLSRSNVCAVLLMIALTVLSSCASQQQKNRRKPAKKATVTKTETKPVKMVASTTGENMQMLHVPTGDVTTSAVTLTNSSPWEVNLGQEYDFDISARNLTNGNLEGVTVTDLLPDNLEFISSDPAVSAREGQRLVWVLGDLNEGETRNIRVRVKPTATGNIKHCADIVYNQAACVNTRVVEPQLALTKQMTPAVLTCDTIEVRMVVSNNGTGVARNVVVRSQLPEGLVMADGGTNMEVAIGDLGAGQSHTINGRLMATRSGEFTCDAKATADSGLVSEASASVVATKPALAITKTGPERTYAGKTVSYEVVVSNTGDGVARDTIVTDTLPAGTTFVNSSPAGMVNGGMVSWNLGSLNPEDSRTITITVRTASIAVITNRVSAVAYCADEVRAECSTDVRGIPGLLMEVVDVEDPIQVGNNVVYVIRVTNQGSAPDTNIEIVCTLEETAEYVSSAGATTGSHSAGTLTFKALPSLAPGETVEWRVTVKAVDEGDTRFKVSRMTDNTTRPVEETESTNFYK